MSDSSLIKILIIDSNQNFIDILNTHLVTLNFELLKTTSGKEAQSIMKMNKPDLVLCDIAIHDINGIELLHWIDRELKDVKTILMTDDESIINNQEAIELGAFDLLLKPFSTEELDKSILRAFPNFLMDSEEKDENLTPDAIPYLEISFEEFLTGHIAPVSVYIKLSDRKFVKIIHEKAKIENDIIEKYKSKGIKSIYVEKKEYSKYLDLSLRASQIVKNKKNISQKKKTKFFIHVSDTLQEKLYKDSFDAKDFASAEDFVTNSLEVACKDNAFLIFFNN